MNIETKDQAKADRAARAERAAELRKEQADRAQKESETTEDFELQELELDSRFSREIGKRGVDWAMVSEARIGVIVIVKLGSDLSFRKYIDAVNNADGGVDPTELFNFVSPSVVYPSQEEYAEIARTRGFIANRCADALGHLHGMREKKQAGKF